MYLHLGRETAVPLKDIIGIFDLDTSTYERHTRDFLVEREKQKEIVNVSDDLPKGFVLCESEGKTAIYLTALSSQTLGRRAVQDPLPGNYLKKNRRKSKNTATKGHIK